MSAANVSSTKPKTQEETLEHEDLTAPRRVEGASDPQSEEILGEVREHISLAAELLKKLGPRFSTVSWMVEDTLMYLEDVQDVDENNDLNAGFLPDDVISDLAQKG